MQTKHSRLSSAAVVIGALRVKELTELLSSCCSSSLCNDPPSLTKLRYQSISTEMGHVRNVKEGWVSGNSFFAFISCFLGIVFLLFEVS